MTPAQRRFWDYVQGRAERMEPTLARKILASFASLRDSLSERELLQFVEDGRVDRLLHDATLLKAFRPFRTAVQTQLREQVVGFSKTLPKGLRTTVGFNTLSPNVTLAMQSLDSRGLAVLAKPVRNGVLEVLKAGTAAGQNPRTIARSIRSLVGLAPNQVEAIANFRGLLETGSREALSRALRDRRFDKTLERALGPGGTGLSTKQIDTMVAAYQQRMLAFHAETIARTISLDAMRAANRLAWQTAIDDGLVNEDELQRRWVNAGDSRVRPEHRNAPEGMGNIAVKWRGTWPSGQHYVGEGDFSCRCLEMVEYIKGGVASLPQSSPADVAHKGQRVEEAVARRTPNTPLKPDLRTMTPDEARYELGKKGVVVQFKGGLLPNGVDLASRMFADAIEDLEALGLPRDLIRRFRLETAVDLSGSRYGAFYEGTERIVIYFGEKRNAYTWWSDAMAKELRSGWAASTNPRGTIYHEFGHAMHFANDPVRYRKFARKYMRNKTTYWKNRKPIAAQVSRYGMSDPLEMVAEMFAGLCEGEVYSAEAMAVYKELGGYTPPTGWRQFRTTAPVSGKPPLVVIPPDVAMPSWAAPFGNVFKTSDLIQAGFKAGATQEQIMIELTRRNPLHTTSMKTIRSWRRKLIRAGVIEGTIRGQ